MLSIATPPRGGDKMDDIVDAPIPWSTFWLLYHVEGLSAAGVKIGSDAGRSKSPMDRQIDSTDASKGDRNMGFPIGSSTGDRRLWRGGFACGGAGRTLGLKRRPEAVSRLLGFKASHRLVEGTKPSSRDEVGAVLGAVSSFEIIFDRRFRFFLELVAQACVFSSSLLVSMAEPTRTGSVMETTVAIGVERPDSVSHDISSDNIVVSTVEDDVARIRDGAESSRSALATNRRSGDGVGLGKRGLKGLSSAKAGSESATLSRSFPSTTEQSLVFAVSLSSSTTDSEMFLLATAVAEAQFCCSGCVTRPPPRCPRA